MRVETGMTPVERFLNVLSRLPLINRALNELADAWDDEPPLSLEFAIIGKTLADRGLQLQPNERQLIQAVITTALHISDTALRRLVREALIPTMRARARRYGAARRKAVDAAFLPFPPESDA